MSRSSKSQLDRPNDATPDPLTGSSEWVVACRTCGRELVVETADVNGYLEAGWPNCCGKEMRLTIRPVGD
jgi:hypothetical protein